MLAFGVLCGNELFTQAALKTDGNIQQTITEMLQFTLDGNSENQKINHAFCKVLNATSGMYLYLAHVKFDMSEYIFVIHFFNFIPRIFKLEFFIWRSNMSYSTKCEEW